MLGLPLVPTGITRGVIYLPHGCTNRIFHFYSCCWSNSANKCAVEWSGNEANESTHGATNSIHAANSSAHDAASCLFKSSIDGIRYRLTNWIETTLTGSAGIISSSAGEASSSGSWFHMIFCFIIATFWLIGVCVTLIWMDVCRIINLD